MNTRCFKFLSDQSTLTQAQTPEYKSINCKLIDWYTKFIPPTCIYYTQIYVIKKKKKVAIQNFIAAPISQICSDNGCWKCVVSNSFFFFILFYFSLLRLSGGLFKGSTLAITNWKILIEEFDGREWCCLLASDLHGC